MRAPLLLLHGLFAASLMAQGPVTGGPPVSADLAEGSPAAADAPETDRSLVLFPNPTRGSIRISRGQGLLTGNWSLVDAAGREVLVGRFRGFGDAWLDLASLPEGIYRLRPELGADWFATAITVVH